MENVGFARTGGKKLSCYGFEHRLKNIFEMDQVFHGKIIFTGRVSASDSFQETIMHLQLKSGDNQK